MADTILLGRVTYKAMAQYWPSSMADPFFPRDDMAIADMMNSYSKIVFSKTLKTTQWNNSRLARGNPDYEIAQLKQQQGKNIIIYGSNKLVSTLADFNLVDQYQVWIHPVVLGQGKALFRDLRAKLDMKLLGTKTFSSGVVMLNYEMAC
jgi:dihydrofolate reductase